MKSIAYIALISFLLQLTACNKDQVLPDDGGDNLDSALYKLAFIESFLLDIAEPSGLSWSLNHNDLIVVDDRSNQAYIIDIKGDKRLAYAYKGDDTEGVTIDENTNTIWIAEEEESKLKELDSNGNELNSFKIDVDRGSKKKGLEGLSFDSEKNIFYILNEAEPGLLIKWQKNGGVISQKKLKFAQDYSGIFFDNADRSLWMLSDKSKKLFYCDENAVVRQSFDLDFEKAEGIVVDISNNRVYIVSDSERRLYVYKITK